jgi:PAS domain-containing protein
METLNYPERRLPADSLASANRQLLIDIDDVHTVAQGIVDTILDPLLVLDQHLRVVSANRAFCQTFRMSRQNIEDCPVYALGDGQWNIPALRFLLEISRRSTPSLRATRSSVNFPESDDVRCS